MSIRLCPISVYEYPCEKTNCKGCAIYEAREGKRLCSVCGADKVIYLDALHTECWHGHKELKYV